MLKDTLASIIGKENYVNIIMFITKTYHAVLGFHHPGARLIRQLLLRRGSVVLDIGAHIGQFTGMAARAVGQSGRVYSFEPVPMVLRSLRAMVKIRGFRQVAIIETALSDRNGTAEINIPLKDGWKPLIPVAHLGNAAEGPVQRLKIQIKRLDDFCEEENIRRIDFIKCDTEGSEFSVFSGGLKCLARDLPVTICEINREYLARQKVEPSALFGLFQGLGYHAYSFNQDGTVSPVEGYANSTDYLFVHPLRFDIDSLEPWLKPVP
jgi:FkbM family methyltransferase